MPSMPGQKDTICSEVLMYWVRNQKQHTNYTDSIWQKRSAPGSIFQSFPTRSDRSQQTVLHIMTLIREIQRYDIPRTSYWQLWTAKSWLVLFTAWGFGQKQGGCGEEL